MCMHQYIGQELESTIHHLSSSNSRLKATPSWTTVEYTRQGLHREALQIDYKSRDSYRENGE
jgi:hypothetical protein